MEALRQSSPQPGALGADPAVPAELGAAAPSRLLDPRHRRHRAPSRRICLLARLSAKTSGSALETAPVGQPALCLHPLLAGRLPVGVPALRGILQPGCHPAYPLADAGGAPPPAGMERVRRGRWP